MEMNQLNLHYLIWLGKTFAKNLGMWGLVGLFLVLASATFYAVKVTEVAQNIQLENIDLINEAKKSNDFNQQVNHETPQNTAEEVAQFYGRFPTLEALPKILEELNVIAKKQGIEIDVGDYKLNELKNSQISNPRDLTKYEIIFPLQGKYGQIRTFVAESLQKFPEIALMDLQITRDGSTNPQVEAILVFAVYVKVAK